MLRRRCKCLYFHTPWSTIGPRRHNPVSRRLYYNGMGGVCWVNSDTLNTADELVIKRVLLLIDPCIWFRHEMNTSSQRSLQAVRILVFELENGRFNTFQPLE